jgi:hypothetical protein
VALRALFLLRALDVPLKTLLPAMFPSDIPLKPDCSCLASELTFKLLAFIYIQFSILPHGFNG